MSDEFNEKQRLEGDQEKSMDIAMSKLTGLGFQLKKRGDSTLKMESPGMRSSKQPPLMGAGLVSISWSGERVTLRCDYAGLNWLTSFVRLFPPALVTGIFGIQGMVLMTKIPLSDAKWIPFGVMYLGFMVLWSFLGRFMPRVFRLRTEKALHEFLNTISVCGKEQGTRG